ncbi:hypothetical protein [Bacillus sp. NEB1478]|uniref:hypothetical protein n=1 Tax=Bacillus sp. NEB1478 TaxID=3073816 RepID=UPI002873686C|nr:hypothetical protein [Bacillus sp. NEB1478]WNB90951.1 hypothetical protein RGB74_13665 [Bacillus sp. NEB1478]
MSTATVEMIKSKRKMVLLFNYIWMVLLGGVLFPIGFQDDLLFSISMLAPYFYMGYIFSVLYEKKIFVVFLSAFLLNGIGLFWRVLLEWGEDSMIRDLTAWNAGIFLISIPLFITIVSYFLQSVSRHKTTSGG